MVAKGLPQARVAVALAVLLIGSLLGFAAPAAAGEGGWTTHGPTEARALDVVVDPSNQDVAYVGAGGNGVLKTVDGGAHWQVRSSGPMAARSAYDLAIDPSNTDTVYAAIGDGILRSSDGGLSWEEAGLQDVEIYAIAVASTSPTTLYAGGRRPELPGYTGGVYVSTDGGETWTETLVAAFQVRALAVDPTSPTTVYAGVWYTRGSDVTVFKTTDGGTSWKPRNDGVPHGVIALSIDPTSPETIYAGTRDGVPAVYKSTNGARSWSPTGDGLGQSEAAEALSIDPTDPQRLFAATSCGLFESGDAGAHWTKALGNDCFRSVAMGSGAAPLVYAGGTGTLYQSTDGGDSWRSLRNGLTNSAVSSVVIQPGGRQVVFAATDIGLQRSNDGGAHWVDVPDVDADRVVVVAPSDANVIYAADDGLLWRSFDGGLTWERSKPQELRPIYSIEVDPADPTTVYVGSRDLLKSTDGGQTFVKLSGIGADVVAVAIDPLEPSILYAASGGTDDVYRSTDGGASWKRMPIRPVATRDMCGDILDLVADPAHQDTVYAAGCRGLFRTADAGIHWTNVLRVERLNAVAIDHADPSKVYAGGYGEYTRGFGMFRSLDGGDTWSAFNRGLKNPKVAAIAVDGVTGQTLHVATDGGGVYDYSGA
jgi:photosystem II stability/assembly factor-like uncharacterized protein